MSIGVCCRQVIYSTSKVYYKLIINYLPRVSFEIDIWIPRILACVLTRSLVFLELSIFQTGLLGNTWIYFQKWSGYLYPII